MDQISSIEGKITAQIVEELTGLQDPAKLEAVIEARQKNQTDEVIKLLKELFDAGAEPSIVTQQMLDMVQGYVESAENKFSQDYLLGLAEQLHWVQANLKISTVPQLLLITGLCREPTLTNTLKTIPKSKSAVAKQSAIQQKAVSDSTNSKGDDDTKIVKALSVIKNYNNSLYAVLRGAQLSVKENEVRVVCRFSFHKERLAEPKNRTLIEKVFSKVYGEDMHVSISIEEYNKPAKIDKEQELINSAIAILGGEVVDG
jgi:DNA polymerase III gamma/tau subunit